MERIKIQQGHFAKPDGSPFILNGMHFIRFGPSGHYVFTYPHYSESECRRLLRDFSSHGFNVMRVFNGTDLDMYRHFDRYVSAFRSFLRIADEFGVYVILEISGYPGPDGDRDERFSVDHARIFDSSMIAGQKQFAERYLSQLDDAERPVIIAIELMNEVTAHADQLPFSTQATDFAFRGSSYNLSTDDGRQSLLDEGIMAYANEMTAFVHGIDREWLLSVSVFTPALVGRSGFPDNQIRHGGNPSQQRIPYRPLAIAHSSVSYVDFHVYVMNDVAGEMSNQLTTGEFDQVRQQCDASGKALLLGEFGIYKGDLGIDAAANAASRLAQRGLEVGFDGHVFWSYDGDNAGHFVAREEDFQIIKALTLPSARKEVGDFGSDGTLYYSDGYYSYPLPHAGLHLMHKGAVGPRRWLGHRQLNDFGPNERWTISQGYFLFSFGDPDATPEDPPASPTRYFSEGGGRCVGFTSHSQYLRHLAQNPGMPQFGVLTNAHQFLTGFQAWSG